MPYNHVVTGVDQDPPKGPRNVKAAFFLTFLGAGSPFDSTVACSPVRLADGPTEVEVEAVVDALAMFANAAAIVS